MSKTITEAVSELSQGMSHLELYWENQRLRHHVRVLGAEVERLRGVIYRNADPFAASDADAAIIEKIAKGEIK